MKKTASHTATSLAGPRPSQSIDVVRAGHEAWEIAWRIIAPVAIGAIVGVLLGAQVGARPWLGLLGVVLGFVVAGWLVRRQLGDAEAEDKRHEQ